MLALPPIGAAMIQPICGRYASFLPAEAISRMAEPGAALELARATGQQREMRRERH